MAETKVAVVAGGCFWCVESSFKGKEGIIDTEVGYMGGGMAKPTYDHVKTGKTGHAEVVRVTYDANKIDYAGVLDIFFNLHDPTDEGGQGPDRGTQYRTAIFYADASEKDIAAAKIAELDAAQVFKQPIVTTLEQADQFWPGEQYHQDFYDKNPATGAMYTAQKLKRLKAARN